MSLLIFLSACKAEERKKLEEDNKRLKKEILEVEQKKIQLQQERSSLKIEINSTYGKSYKSKIPMTKCSECGDDSDTWICDKCRAI